MKNRKILQNFIKRKKKKKKIIHLSLHTPSDFFLHNTPQVEDYAP
jgi:hypothetical protein